MQYRTNQLNKITAEFQQQLSKIYDEREAVNIIYLLIEHYLGLSRSDLALQPEYRISESELLKLHFALKRLLREEPIQYILGETTFYGLRFLLNSSVLIPRQETEQLVQLVLENASPGSRILDVGTGSGCIALSLKSRLPNATISAIDVSNEALEIAKENASHLGLDVEFLRLDILAHPSLKEKFDIIVSNPPYVTKADKKLMKNNVLKWEPELALFVNDDKPLVFYDAIASFGLHHLALNGMLFFEINENYGSQIVDLLKKRGYKNIRIYQDINGKKRFVKASHF